MQQVPTDLRDILFAPSPMRAVFVMIIILVVAYLFSTLITRLIIRLAQHVALWSDNESNAIKARKWREIETYLSVVIAVTRFIIMVTTVYVLWRVFAHGTQLSGANSSLAAIGASAFFIVFAGQSLGMLIRDVTAGFVMIAEKWFTIGDYVKVEPFWEVSGVVERMTLRSTKIRSLSGEVVWINNQNIHAVHVSPKGVRTMAVDVYVRDRAKGEQELDKIIKTIPTGPTMLASPLRVTYAERWGDDLWRINVTGQTLPGREWLIEKHFVGLVEMIDRDVDKESDRLVLHTPIARFADADAERKFRRAIRVQKMSHTASRDHKPSVKLPHMKYLRKKKKNDPTDRKTE